MSTFKEMKFLVKDEVEESALIAALEKDGYEMWHGSCNYNVGAIRTYSDGDWQKVSGSDMKFSQTGGELTDAAAFLASHEPPTPFRAMKFKVGSPAQSESLQKALQALGYDHAHPAYKGKCVFTSRKDIFTDNEGVITSNITEECYDNEEGEEMDAADFIGEHAVAVEEYAVKHPDGFWFENTGEMPDLPEGTLIDYKMRGDDFHSTEKVSDLRWNFKDNTADIVQWRFNRSEDASVYFKQPKMEPKDVTHNAHVYGVRPLNDKVTIHMSDASIKLFEGIASSDSFTAEAAHEAFAGVKRNKYMREIKPGVFCDVYEVLRAFNVTDGALAHMVKKCLAVGQRGHKDATEDYKDIVASAQRALELHLEWKDAA